MKNKGWLFFIGLTLAIAMVSVCTFTASAENLSGQCGESATWVLDAADTLTISGSGFMDTYSAYGNDQPWYGQREKIKTIVVEEGINKIGEFAFDMCDSFTTVTQLWRMGGGHCTNRGESGSKGTPMFPMRP